VTVDNNVVGHIVHRTTFHAQSTIDLECGITICSLPGGTSGCKAVSLTNNIIGGVIYAAVVSPGYDCGDTSQTVMRNNVGHSVQGTGMGHGLVVNRNDALPSTARCLEASSFAAYKCTYMGAASYQKTDKLIFTGMTMIDNVKGFGAHIAPTSAGDYGEHTVQISDNIIIGESLAPDCPQEKEGGYCFKFDKYGLQIGMGATGSKPYHITDTSILPVEINHGSATWGGRNLFMRNHFKDFAGVTREGTMQSTFDIDRNPDLVPMSWFVDTTFENVGDGAWGHIREPSPGWANVKDCGAFPCTGPLNVLLMFTGSKYTGQRPSYTEPAFQLISNNEGMSPYIPGCEKREKNNLYLCQQTNLA